MSIRDTVPSSEIKEWPRHGPDHDDNNRGKERDRRTHQIGHPLRRFMKQLVPNGESRCQLWELGHELHGMRVSEPHPILVIDSVC